MGAVVSPYKIENSGGGLPPTVATVKKTVMEVVVGA
jgi:hypothetical protein